MTITCHPFSHLILAPSETAAMEFLALQRHSFSDPERLWFFYYGSQPNEAQFNPMMKCHDKKKIILLHEDDLLGRVSAIKIACWLKKRAVKITYQSGETIRLEYRDKRYDFPEHQLSLNRFEKCSGFRSQIRTYKLPKQAS
ncbi:hypothetical protein [Pedobacter sp. GR22-6]|uniref:hypothetical protein n=1 Tax=Pedobacter sp. GR22-6 TaxID=3127957 RepID=UPI00307DFAF1